LSKKVAIIGIGNTLRRDDGIGIVILESLLNFYKRRGLEYLNFGSASFDLLHRIKSYDVILIIDGINAGLEAAELKVGKLKDLRYKLDSCASSTHELNLKIFFELSQEMGIKTKIYLAGIQVKDTSYGAGLSQALEDKKEGLIRQVSLFIDKNFL